MKSKFTKMVASFLISLVIAVTFSCVAFALNAPVLTVTTSGLDVYLSWTSMPGVTGYNLYYAPYPYAGTHTIGNVDMGANTFFSATLWDGASYYVAITANDGSSESGYSNIGFFGIESESVVSPQIECDSNNVGLCATKGC